MRLEELDIEIPAELIAQAPADPRDSCRLMVVDPAGGSIQHARFSSLPDLLDEGDVLVINDSRVLPARLHVHKTSGGRVELLFLKESRAAGESDTWEALARPSGRLRAGQTLLTGEGHELQLVERLGEGRWHVRSAGSVDMRGLLEAEGDLPLPPYIHVPLARQEDYQTVYARVDGSAAAPTAGLHFTPDVLSRLTERGVEVAAVTLHVGLDTFRPVTEGLVEQHAIHTEAYDVEPQTAHLLDEARAQGRRVVAVGTTAVRVLETLYRDAGPGAAHTAPLHGATDIFIMPGHRYRAVDALLTNFHLPRTSLLALVMAFAGVEPTRRAYAEAVTCRYRFFSFGDAMLVTGPQRPSGGIEAGSREERPV